MRAHRAEFPLTVMCRMLGLFTGGYYGWSKRPPSARARRNQELQGMIRSIWSERGETCDRLRIHAVLRARGERVGQKTGGAADEASGHPRRDLEADGGHDPQRPEGAAARDW